MQGTGPSFDDILKKAEKIGEIRVIIQVKEEADKMDYEELVALGRKVFEQKKVVGILGCNYEGPKIIVARSKDLDINSIDLARVAGNILGGGGGGKPEFAQAGGSAKENLQKAVDEVKNILKGSS